MVSHGLQLVLWTPWPQALQYPSRRRYCINGAGTVNEVTDHAARADARGAACCSTASRRPRRCSTRPRWAPTTRHDAVQRVRPQGRHHLHLHRAAQQQHRAEHRADHREAGAQRADHARLDRGRALPHKKEPLPRRARAVPALHQPTAPHRTAPHRTAPHRAAPCRTVPCRAPPFIPPQSRSWDSNPGFTILKPIL
jgi:hypothetical protein